MKCSELTGHLRDICRGVYPGKSIEESNRYRAVYGMPPLIEPMTPEEIAKDEHQQGPPSLIIRGINFAAALMRHALSGLQKRSSAEIEKRLAICQDCEFKIGDGETFNCSRCGCQCSASNEVFLNKLAWKSEVCPEGKWS